MSVPRRLVVGITGASGSIYGVRLLERLRDVDVESHLILSRWGARTLQHETRYSVEQVQRLADVVYASTDQGAAVSSGSFQTMGMVVLPCSVKTLGQIATCTGESLIPRAADVVLKERRRLVLASCTHRRYAVPHRARGRTSCPGRSETPNQLVHQPKALARKTPAG